MCKDAGITEDVSLLITGFKPDCTMNDRASTARKASRFVLGIGADGNNDPTCAHHAITNIFEEARKAMDGVLKATMNITEEQAKLDAGKMKNMRTHVGWFLSPVCALIYQLAKYCALHSSKGYAVGLKTQKWMLAEEHVSTDDLSDELLGHFEDMLAICGSRDYVFFHGRRHHGALRAGRQPADLPGGGGRARRRGGRQAAELHPAGHELTAHSLGGEGYGSDCRLSALEAAALHRRRGAYPGRAARHVGDDARFLQAAAANPRSLIDGSLKLELGGSEAKVTPRSLRAAVDMNRIRAASAGDTLIESMLAKAFFAMAAGVRNHACDFLPACSRATSTPQRCASGSTACRRPARTPSASLRWAAATTRALA